MPGLLALSTSAILTASSSSTPPWRNSTASLIDLVVASTKESIVMVEAGAREASEDILTKGINFGHQANQDIIRLQEELRAAYGKPKVEAPVSRVNPEIINAIR